MGVREVPRVAVVGGGAAGLSAGLRLRRRGYDVELFERDGVLGGRMGAATLGDRAVMLGGKNIGRKYTTFREMIDELGDFAFEPFGINASRVKDGKVDTLDSTRKLNSLLTLWRSGSLRDLVRLARLAKRIRDDESNRFLGAPYFEQLAAASDDRPLSAHFGAEITESLLKPMTMRNNGAQPSEMYLGTFNTNLALLMDHYDQLTDGLGPVLEAYAKQVGVRLGAPVTGLVDSGGRVTGVRVEQDGVETEERFDAVVLAAPAFAAARIVRARLPELAERLDRVRYFPSTVAVVEYDAPVFRADVRALALDEGPCSNAGVYGRDTRDVVRYTFSGSNCRVPDPTPEQIDAWITETEQRLVRYLGITIPRRGRLVVRHWPAAYCGYVPFHGEFLAGVRSQAARLAGLELAGDYLMGASLEACSRSGTLAAQRLADHLDTTKALV